MKSFLSALFIVFISVSFASAQQRPQYSQYSLNNMLVNPAVAGIENYTDVKLGLRKQWAGLEGAPETYYTSFNMPIGNEDRNRINSKSMIKGGTPKKAAPVNRNNKFHKKRPHHGVGGIVQVDKTGPLTNTGVNLNYAFHLPVTKKVVVALGSTAGINQFTLNRGLVTTMQSNDPALAGNNLSTTRLDLGFGAWVYGNRFFGGISAMQLLSNERGLLNKTTELQPAPLEDHFYLTGGYRFFVSRNLTLVPSVMIKTAQSGAVSPDLNVKAILANRVWTGASYRHQDSFTILAGINISPLLDLGYSYDAITSELRHASSGSHEVVIGIKLQNYGKAICPQWMW